MNEASELFLLSTSGSSSCFRDVARVISTAEEARRILAKRYRARWLIEASSELDLLLRIEAHNPWHRALVLVEMKPIRRECLRAQFRDVIAPGDGVCLLGKEELAEVLATENPDEYFIGGVVNRDDDVLVLFRGNFERLLVPLDWFRRDRPPFPDFDDFEIVDTGQTICFGDYEAAADAVLYEFDRRARRRMKQREIAQDRSFGGALRRLRLQKGLSRADFPGIDPKTIARIERGEVSKPREETLLILAKTLGVAPEEIESF